MDRHIKILLWLVLGAVMYGCKSGDKNKKLRVGVSYQNLQNEFIINIQDGMRKKAKELGIELIESDGQGKAENQVSQIENFISLGVDAIILNPFDKNGSAPAVNKAVQEGIPIIVVNAVVSNLDKANAYVGSEDKEAGRIVATKIVDLIKGKGNIAIIHGAYGHSAEIERSEGIQKVLIQYPSIKIVFEQTANWDRAQGLSLMENWISTGKEINAVIALNDEMALGAYKAIEGAGRQKNIFVIGIDAIKDALRSVEENKMAATVFQDANGQASLALELAKQATEKKTMKHLNYIPFQLVTRENYKKFQ
ncbi:MAG: substrate-binding domain-containing protein [Ferruginibacter sp.]